ncbi:MAG: hypothetical protein DMF73_11015 [Acidobacteria bacterium]|nr:MAG: hypothetical protein DMF73_11015 [Acidobacteriota bacterium]
MGLCGEITRKNIHHRGTELTQRTTEDFFPIESFSRVIGRVRKKEETVLNGFQIFAWRSSPG